MFTAMIISSFSFHFHSSHMIYFIYHWNKIAGCIGFGLHCKCNLTLVKIKSAKQHQYPCSVTTMDSMNYQIIYISNFLSSWFARQWYFQQSNHGSYLNPGTQVGSENEDFGTVLQMDLTRVSFVCSALMIWEARIIALWK